ncbi:ABC transporter permease [Nakamurella lactea]|uniref:ABC transporter permease n=1 Tax=Nakamurella lactea TaxID=459515 RepID=UPI0013766BB3|nr:FtsX-like permease family protein [Nakamurella lactea]
MPVRLWRLLIVRVTLAGSWRTLLAATLIAVPLALTVAAVAGANGVVTTAEQKSELTTGGHDYAASIGERAVPKDLNSKLGGAAVLAASMLDVMNLPVTSPSGGDEVRYFEAPWSNMGTAEIYRMTNGKFPTASGSVALSTSLSQELGVAVGDTVLLAHDRAHPAVVVGTFVHRRAVSGNFILAGEGTWSTLRSPALVRGSLFPFRTLYLDRGASDAQFDPQVLGGGSVIAATLAAGDPFYVQQPLLVAIPLVVLLTFVIAGGFMLGLRRLQTDLSVLAALGLSPARIRIVVTAASLLVALIGAVLGVLIGALAGPIMGSLLASALDREMVSPARIGVSGAGVLLAVVAGATALAGAIVSRVVAAGIANGVAARPVTDSVPTVAERVAARRGVQAVALAVAVVAVVFLRDGPLGAIVAVLAVMVLLSATARDLIGGLAWLLSRVGLIGRLSGWLASRDRGRSIVVAAVVMAGVCLPIGIGTSAQSSFDRNLAARTPTVPIGQIDINTHGQALDGAALAALRTAAGAPIVPSKCLSDRKYRGCWSIATGDNHLDVLVVDSVADVQPLTSYQPAGRDTQALHAGSILVLASTAAWPSSRDRTQLLSPDGKPMRTATAVHADGVLPAGVSAAVVLASAQAVEGLTGTVQRYRTTAPTDRLAAVRAVAIAHLVAGRDVTVDEPPTEVLDGFSQFAVLLGAILALLTAIGVTLMTLRERRRTGDQLGMLGMSRRAVKGIGVTASLVPVLAGAGIGAICGLAVAWLRLLETDIPLAVPWRMIVLVAAGVVILTLVAIASAPSPRLSQLRDSS